jgi:hypothetical protein
MAIAYTWDFSTVDTYPTKDSKADVIHNVHWRLTGTDDTNKDSKGAYQTATSYGSESLDTSDLSSFKAFASVAKADVQGWVETALGSDEVTKMKANIDSQIAAKVTPTSVQKTIA